MQLAALTTEVAQPALRRRQDSPTRPARPDVEETPRLSSGGSSRTRGSLPGWPSSASSRLVLETTSMTSSRVSFPLPLPPVQSLIRTHFHARPVAISLGSPALAAYSLALTSLNTRLVYRRAQGIKHESRGVVARALISLQQIPLELTRNDRRLAFIPVKKQWKQEVTSRLNRRYFWPIAIGSSVTWVVIAFIFTLVDSFVDLDISSDGGAEGHAVGTLWL